MIEILLIRHGKTKGNVERRYIGKTDEPLSKEGIQEIEGKEYPQISFLGGSPMLRCKQSADIAYGSDYTYHTYPGLKEMDFGDFENKNYEELNGNEKYQAWIDSNGTDPFPNGEDKAGFIHRCLEAWEEVVSDLRNNHIEKAALFLHGGTIMSILSTYGDMKKDYFDWKTENACGYFVELDPDKWITGEKVIYMKKEI